MYNLLSISFARRTVRACRSQREGEYFEGMISRGCIAG
jgi:hypothetical protein